MKTRCRSTSLRRTVRWRGDFSTGAEGLRIHGGAVGEPLREFTIASTLQKMLKDIEAVGSDLEFLPMSAAGVSVVIRDVTLSGA